MLGPLEVLHDGRQIVVRGRQRRLLLATLVLHRNTVVSVDRLVDVLFRDDPPERASGTVQSYISRLRRDFGDGDGPLQTRPPGYVMQLLPDDLDAARFERRVADAIELHPSDPAKSAALLTEGLAWWRGPAFGEFVDDPALQAEGTRLDEVRQRALEVLVDALLALGEQAEAVGLLETCIADRPLREQFRAQHMLALYRCGRHPEAVRAYHRFRSELSSELGLEPSAALARLETQILQQDPTLDLGPTVDATADRNPAAIEIPSGAPTRPSVNLPLPLNALVGRDVDVSELRTLLHANRMLTLTGPGGVGKTRLALRLAELSAEEFPDGVWLCDLAAIREPGLAADAITTALDVQRRQDRSALESLVEVLKPRHFLVVFDNCEHLLESIGQVVEAVLRSCPGVRILATSREPLAVDGETVWSVRPLSVPEAKDLFVERARAALPEFELTPTIDPTVVEICRRLDGIPLAIELAAARVRSMTPIDVAAGLDERFTLLTAGRRSEPRHQTLLAAVEWSYDLLDLTEQALFRRLSVFAGTFTLEDAEQVCSDAAVTPSDTRASLPALVDKSMVVADISESSTRYALLETLREFGRQQLAVEGAARDLEGRHAAHHLEVVDRAEAELGGPDERRWTTHLDSAFDDLRIAHRWAIVNGDLDAALRLVAGAREFAFRAMRYELFTWAEATLAAQTSNDHPLTPLVLAIAGYGRFARGDLGSALVLAERSIALEQRLGLPPCGLHWRTMGNVYYYRGDSTAAAEACERMTRAARASGDAARLVHALYMTSVGLASAARTNESRLLAEEAVSLARRIENPTAIASSLYARALTLEALDPGRAASMLEEASQQGASVGNRWIEAFARTELVSLAARRGDLDDALRLATRVIDTWYRAGDWANQWLTLRHVAGVLAQRGSYEEAAVLHGALRVASADLALPIEASDLRRLAVILDQLPSVLGPARTADAESRGAAMSGDAVVYFAQEAIAGVLDPA